VAAFVRTHRTSWKAKPTHLGNKSKSICIRMSSSSIDSKHDTTSDTDTKEEEDDLAATLESKLKVTVADETTEKDEEHLVSDAPEALKQVAEMIKNVENILVLTGAGVSVAAGIPDFRTPGTGLYDNLQKYDLSYPEAVFDIQFYRENPQPFVLLASELWPNFLSQTAPKPTLTHTFVALLSDKGRLLRNYSQVSRLWGLWTSTITDIF
jgi:NAD+-dependent protein deacetylase sirtuin 2